jgi:hypothetical protein
MELGEKKLVVDIFFFFLNDEWGMKSCEEVGVMMMVVRRSKGSWHIVKG